MCYSLLKQLWHLQAIVSINMLSRISEWGDAISAWFLRHKERIGIIAIGHTAKQIEEFLLDWLLYGFVVFKTAEMWGPYQGALIAFAIMAPLSALLCYSYIRFYDWAKKDWLGLETIEELRQSEEAAGPVMRWIIKLTKLGDFPMFVVLSIYGDPFVVTLYFRRGAHLYNGLSRRDWSIFWASVVFSNAYWTLQWGVIVALIQPLWQFVIVPVFMALGIA